VTAFAFATSELWPLTDGGAGRLNADLVSMLRTAGHDVRVVLVADVATDDENIRVVRPTDAAGWDIGFMAASKAAAEGLAELHRESPIDRIEIQDFDGLPFWTLTHRGDLGFAETPITVRFHGSVDLQIEAMGAGSATLEVAAQMERESFAMADASIAPSDGIRSLMIDRYHLEPDRVVVGTPVIRDLTAGVVEPRAGIRFTVVGRLSEVKGSHDMVAASIPVLEEFPQATVTFVGSDGWSATANVPMRQWLTSMVPDDMKARVIFHVPVDDTRLAAIIADSTAVVAPSRFESFNLAVHEARRLGAPLVLPQIPAFSSMFGGEFGADMYDGSVEGLTAALTRLARDPSLSRRLAAQPAPRLGDPIQPYQAELPPVWHRRSQGGLATAALARVEHVRFPAPELARHRQILQSLIRRTPDGVLDAVNRILPARVRDRIRNVSDWDWETEDQRQKKGARWAEVRRRIADGELGKDDSPHVSIVIPCFNQGAFIEEALLTIFEQTYDNYDVLIVDDGSDDGTTPKILDALEFPRVGVLHQDNVGLPGARNRGIAAARGDYVVTLDADDELAPLYLEKLASALDSDDDVAFAHCWARIFGDYQAIWATRPFNRFQFLLSNSVVGCVMLRKTAWEAVGGYDESMLEGNEDWDLWIRLTDAGFGNIQITEPLFWYRKHGVSMSVETEARYESVLSSLSQRLPDIYTIDHMRGVKRESYPMLCVMTDNRSLVAPFEDVQLMQVAYDDIHSVVDDVRSKYVVWWPLGADADPAILSGLSEVLEQDDTIGAVETTGAPAIRVVRTWSLRDPDAPSDTQSTGFAGSSGQQLACGQFPSDDWQVPADIGGIDVHRQRPEESGIMPTWVDV